VANSLAWIDRPISLIVPAPCSPACLRPEVGALHRAGVVTRPLVDGHRGPLALARRKALLSVTAGGPESHYTARDQRPHRRSTVLDRHGILYYPGIERYCRRSCCTAPGRGRPPLDIEPKITSPSSKAISIPEIRGDLSVCRVGRP
jgi:hypothetical protein